MAALVTATSRPSCRISPSTTSRRWVTASAISGRVMRAFVTAMVGRMSTPSAIWAAKAVATLAPQGSSETIFLGSDHCGWGPKSTIGEVLVRSGRTSGFMAPELIARAR